MLVAGSPAYITEDINDPSKGAYNPDQQPGVKNSAVTHVHTTFTLFYISSNVVGRNMMVRWFRTFRKKNV